jgi:hypothetical protein
MIKWISAGSSYFPIALLCGGKGLPAGGFDESDGVICSKAGLSKNNTIQRLKKSLIDQGFIR